MQTLREAKVIVPQLFPGRQTDETTREVWAFEHAITEVFGGLTKVAGRGIDWTTPQGEPVWIYTVAMYPLPDNEATLVRMAFEVWAATDQQFGYLVLPSGDVVFVDVEAVKRNGVIPLPGNRFVAASASASVTSEGLHNARKSQ